MIGKLRYRIGVYVVSGTTSDGMGGISNATTQLYKTKWADVVEKPVKRVYQEQMIKHNRYIQIVIRKDNDILSKYLIKYDDVYFTIDSIWSDLKWTYINCYR